MPKRFTLAEANRMIPHVEPLLKQALALKNEFQEAAQSFQSIGQRVTMMGGMVLNRDQAIDSKHRRDDLGMQLKTLIEKVQEFGCTIKDLDRGLIDFPTLFRGTEVCLCWKLGEADIAWWHSTEEGFGGRKPIDQDFLDHHRGDRAQ